MYEADEDEYDDKAYAEAHIAWLQTVGPDDWHRTVLAFQWAERFDPLMWIVQQDDCDRATALKIFWAMSPEIDDAEGVRSRRTPNWTSDNEIAEYIANRLHGKGYPRAEIAWDAEPMLLGDYERFLDEVRKYEDPLWRPHPDMIRSIRGREVSLDDGFQQRCPEQFAPVMIEDPPLTGLFPYMEKMRSEIDTILFNLAGFGVGIGALIYNDWAEKRDFVLAAVTVVAMLWAATQIRSSAAVVRGLLRADYVVPSKTWGAIIGATVIATGVLAAYVFVRVPVLDAIMALSGAGATAARVAVAIAILTGFWLVARTLSKRLILRAYN